MKALELRKWLDWNFDHDNIAEDADVLLLLSNSDCGYVYLNNPVIDKDGDIVLDDKE